MRTVKFRAILGIYLLFLAVYLLTGSGHFRVTDEVAVYLATQGLVENGSLAIRPMLNSVVGADGKSYNQFGTGQSIASIPFYLVGRAVDQLHSETIDKYFAGLQISDMPGNVYGGTVPIFFVSLFNQFVTPLTCVVVYLFCLALGFSFQTSFLTTLVFGFSTAAWVYARDYFQHPLESFLLLFTAYTLCRHRHHLQERHALLAGAVFALGLLTRLSIAIAAPAIVLYLWFIISQADRAKLSPKQRIADVRVGEFPQFLVQWFQRLLRGWATHATMRYLVVFLLPVALSFIVMLYLNHLKFGNYLLFHPDTVTKGFSTTPLWLGLYGYLFSVGRSIFLYSPPAALALFAYPRFFRQRWAEATLFTAIVVTYLTSYSIHGLWTGGWCYGPRFLTPVIPFLVIPLGYILEGTLARVAAAALAVLGAGVQILGVAINLSYVYVDWRNMNLSPEAAFLFVPDISPIPTHLKALLEGRHVDLWVLWVYQQFGPTVTALTLALPLALLVGSFILLTDRVQHRSIRAAVVRVFERLRASRPATSDSSEAAAEPRPARWLAALALCLAVGFNLYHLYPEAATQPLPLNDDVLHLIALEQTASALAAGQNPTDFWLGTIVTGYPLFRHYQHLAYLPGDILHHLSGGALSLSALLYWTQYLLLSLFPLSIYWSLRRFGFARAPAALAGLTASLLATNYLFGFDYGSYVWRGSGMYTQLWGMFILPPALAESYIALRTGRCYVRAVALLAVTLLCHLVLGYVALISLAAFAIVQCVAGLGVWTTVRRLGLLLLLLAGTTAYFWVPYWLDRAYMNRSFWEEAFKYDSFGHQWVLGALVKGELFDFGRAPVLTLLAGLGLVRCLWRWREDRYRIPVVLFMLWLLLYFGRPTWGPLLDLLPLSRDLHFHRLIAGLHLGGIYLIGIGLAWPWQWALARKKWAYLAAATGLTALLLLPAYAERREYLVQNTRWLADSQTALAAEEQDLTALIDALRKLPPGRVYAGLGNNWGRQYATGSVPMYALLNGAGFDMLGYAYHALSLNADVQLVFNEEEQIRYDLYNVRYVVAPQKHPVPSFMKLTEQFGRHCLYQVTTSGYFDLVDTDVAFTGVKEQFYPAATAWLESALPAAKQHPAILFEPVPGLALSQLPLSQADQIVPQLIPPPDEPRGQITSETIGMGSYLAEVEAARPSTLMLKATYHPGWRATVDGQEARPFMVMPSYVGVTVSPGAHQVHLAYQPGPLRGYLMIAGALLLVLAGLAERRWGMHGKNQM